jgi:hypothetical protein
MINIPDTKPRYFSVRHSLEIQGTRYIPSVCYPLSQGLQAVIEKMTAEGIARVYPEKVRFVTGTPYPVKKSEERPAALQPSSVSAKPRGHKPSAAVEKPVRKSVKGAASPQTKREFD